VTSPTPAPALLVCPTCHGLGRPIPDYDTALATSTSQVGHCIDHERCGAFWSLDPTSPVSP